MTATEWRKAFVEVLGRSPRLDERALLMRCADLDEVMTAARRQFRAEGVAVVKAGRTMVHPAVTAYNVALKEQRLTMGALGMASNARTRGKLPAVPSGGGEDPMLKVLEGG